VAGLDVRVAAVRVMAQMHDGGGSLTKLLPAAQLEVADNDKALLQLLCFGMARWSGQLSGVVDGLLAKPLKRKDADIYLLMQLGVFQLAYTRVAPHAAVDNTVAAVKKMGKPWAKGLVNAVLRNYQRQSDTLIAGLDESASLSHPQWLLDTFKQDWPEHWQAIVEQGNQQAPMTLRVNLDQNSRDAYLEKLAAADIEAAAINGIESAITLQSPVPVLSLPGFDVGSVSVQDAAPQLSAYLLGEGSDQRLLDACSAPGGKTAHALEHGQWRKVIALDQDPARLTRVGETLNRLKLSDRCAMHCADAIDTDKWWDGEKFDAILLDAPCSGTGVIRRHPDIKLLRRATDIDQLVQTQRALLCSLWETLAPGGKLLYATCSILKAENEEQIKWFVEERADASLVEFNLPFGMSRAKAGYQILPGEQGMDGFFYGLLVKSV